MTDNSHLPIEITEQQSAAIYGASAVNREEGPGNAESAEICGTTQEPDLDRLLAEAEQRGYLRGRNEAAAEMMERPAMWQPVAAPVSAGERLTEAAGNFLSGLRPGVWD